MKKIIILSLLLSQLSIIAQNYKFGKVSKEELQERFYPLDSTAEAAYLFKKRRIGGECRSDGLGNREIIFPILIFEFKLKNG